MNLLLAYALQMVNVPYRWGGRHPSEGLDCSHLVYLLLRSQGAIDPGSYTAQTLYNQFQDRARPVSVAELGSLVFYGQGPREIDHIALAINEYTHIESAGGDHTTLSLARAIEQNAFVRITPIRHEKRVAIVMPEYPFRPLP